MSWSMQSRRFITVYPLGFNSQFCRNKTKNTVNQNIGLPFLHQLDNGCNYCCLTPQRNTWDQDNKLGWLMEN